MEISEYEGVTRILMSRVLDGKPVYWVAAYLVDGLLVDTGCHHTSCELADFLQDKPVLWAVNTHYHEDHTGANHLLMSRYGIDIYAHPASIPLIAKGFPLYPYQEIAWGRPVPTTVRPLGDRVVSPGHLFHVLETPGHCEGHVCLIEPECGWCFTGDLFVRENPKFIRPEENIGMIMASMRKLVDFPADRLVLFTSVGKIVEDGRSALIRCIAYFSELAGKVHDLKRKGHGIDEIVREVFGGEHPFAGLTNGQFSSASLVRSLLETVTP